MIALPMQCIHLYEMYVSLARVCKHASRESYCGAGPALIDWPRAELTYRTYQDAFNPMLISIMSSYWNMHAS